MTVTAQKFDDVVMAAVQMEVKVRVKNSIDEQVNEFRKKLESEADLIALRVMRIYEVETLSDRLVITVKKDAGVIDDA